MKFEINWGMLALRENRGEEGDGWKQGWEWGSEKTKYENSMSKDLKHDSMNI